MLFLNPLLACSAPGVTPFSPGWRNEFHAGVAAELRPVLGSFSASTFGNTRIMLTTSAYLAAPRSRSQLLGSDPRSPASRAALASPTFTASPRSTVFSSVAARFFAPQVGGAGAAPAAAGGVFRIDHDEKFNQTTHLQYQPWKKGPWFGFNWRYDSGLVAGAIPVADQSGSVDLGVLTADQQLQAGLFCGPVHPTLATPLGTCNSGYGSTLISLPAPGTENDDHNPPRIAPRHLFDVSVGDDNLFHADKYKWSLQVTAINVANKTALYNFLSTFSGTHYVTPRAMTAELGFHF